MMFLTLAAGCGSAELTTTTVPATNAPMQARSDQIIRKFENVILFREEMNWQTIDLGMLE